MAETLESQTWLSRRARLCCGLSLQANNHRAEPGHVACECSGVCRAAGRAAEADGARSRRDPAGDGQHRMRGATGSHLPFLAMQTVPSDVEEDVRGAA